MANATDIRPFHIEFPEEALEDLRGRINATRWPETETVTDDSQGVPIAIMQELARYWGETYDWRAAETKLDALPNFMAEIDGLDIHFIHMRSNHEDALPLIVTHGWPGWIIEQLKIIEPLTDPTSHGGSASDAFHLVIPSMPGHGFSGKPSTTGWGPQRIARAWPVLMKRLGYEKFVAQGGDWGALIVDLMGVGRASGIARHPYEHGRWRFRQKLMQRPFPEVPRRPTSRRRRGRRSITSRSSIKHGLGYAREDGQPSADAIRCWGFPCRPRGLDPRPRHLEKL